jgi:serine/threonine-protein kinase
MALAAGTRLGPYEIGAQIGSGGMGEVYRATDTNLGRQVAIKVLPDVFAADAERLVRFEREARTLASLNHPNIAIIHGVEKGDPSTGTGHAVRALVMELVEGSTLADRIAHGPMALDEAVPIARQIAGAFEAAHEQGIIHRDLKPANVKVRDDGTVKVLDFGLAKALEPDSPSLPLSMSPTFTSPVMTKVGVLLGTAAYMSPEQARGRIVDKRTDIWAFGCVLYEMLAGRPAFPGETVTETLAAVLERQPDWQALPGSTPGVIRRLLHKCLQKDPKSRLHDIADARLELDEAPSDVTVVNRSTSGPKWWLALAVVAGAAGLAIGWLLGARSEPVTPVVSRWLLDVRPATALLGAHPVERAPFARLRPSRLSIALSPDGRTLAFTAQRDGITRLYVRALDRAEATAVAGTDGADGPFFSPDGRWVGFWASGAIRKAALAGGPPVKISDSDYLFGASWPSDDTIVYASATRTIWKVASAGGAPQALSERKTGEVRHVLPQILNGGTWLLFTVLTADSDWEHSRVVAQSLQTGERKVLLEGAADARYVPTGHLVFMRQGNLMAQPFDVVGARLTGPEVGIIEGVMQSIDSGSVGLDTGAGQYTVSSTGTLIYVVGQRSPDFEATVHWMNRDGSTQQVPVPAPLRPFNLPRLSPDGLHLALGMYSSREWTLWRYGFADRTLARVTIEGRAAFPVWSPDGTQILFRLTMGGLPSLAVVRADGDSTPRQLAPGHGVIFPGSWTPDGQSVIFAEGPTADTLDIKLLSVAGDPRVQPLIETRFNDRMPELSPDGRWLAYVSNETGRDELYVRAFPGLGDKRQISTAGGVDPAWSRNGRKLVFLSRLGKPGTYALMEVDVTPGTTFISSPPRQVFESPFFPDVARTYDLTPDASRFIFTRETYPPSTSAPREMHVVQSWTEELKARVPAGR